MVIVADMRFLGKHMFVLLLTGQAAASAGDVYFCYSAYLDIYMLCKGARM